MKNYYRRRSLHYRGRATRPSKYALFTRKVFYWLVGLYFILGFVIIGARWFFTTQADNFRDEISQAVSAATGVTIHASQFSAGFDKFWPVINLKNVEIARPNGEIALTLPQVSARFSWSSLWHLTPRFEKLVIVDPSLTVRRLNADTFEIAGLTINLNQSEKSSPSNNQLGDWLLDQRKLELINGTVTYIDEQQDHASVIQLNQTHFIFEERLLEWRAALSGQIKLAPHETAPEAFKAIVHINKHFFTDEANPHTWDGRAYFQSNNSNLAELLTRMDQPFLRSGQGQVEAWLDFSDGHITSALADLKLNHIEAQLAPELDPLKVRRLSSRVQYKAQYDDLETQTVEITHLDFATPTHLTTKPMQASLSVRRDAADRLLGATFNTQYSDIGALTSFIPQLPLEANIRQFVKTQVPSGLLRDVSVDITGPLDDPNSWHPSGYFENLTLKAYDQIPGFSQLSGRFAPKNNGDGFTVTLNSQNASLTFLGVFRRPTMPFDALQADVEVSFHPQLQINLPKFSASNSEAALSGRGSWTATGGGGTIDLSGTISRAKAEAVPHYIPCVVGEGILDWLEAGILGGKGSNGTFIVKGPLAKFPWDGPDKSTGRFVIEADLKDGLFDFLPSHQKNAKGQWLTAQQWPLLKNIEAHLRFEGSGMFITGQSARSVGLRASNVQVDLPSYSDAILSVKGRATGDLGNVLRYLNEGVMLKNLLSSAFAESKGKGPADVRLDLSIPLAGDIVKGLKVNIDAKFKDADFYYGINLPTVKKATGELFITQSSVTTKTPITGVSESGHPVTVSANTTDGVLRLGIDATPTTEELDTFLNLDEAKPFFKHLTGTAPIHVDADIGLTRSLIEVTGHTNLKEVVSTLPAPFEKGAHQSWPTTFKVHVLPNAGMRIDVESPKRADVHLVFNKHQGHLALTDGVVNLGTAQTSQEPKGLSIAVVTPYINADKWLPLIWQPESDKPKRPDSAVDRISVVSIEANKVDWLEKSLTNLGVTARRFGRNDWHFRLAGDDAAGQVEYRQGTAKLPSSLKVALTRLHLPDSSVDKFSSEPSNQKAPEQLPDVNVVIDDLRLGQHHVGKVEVQAKNRQDQGFHIWDISQIVIRNVGGTLQGHGQWKRLPKETGETTLSVNARIADTGKMLTSLAVPDAVHGAPATLSTDLKWHNAPHIFDFETLNGRFSSELGAGQFLQVEPGAGRLLSLLSMQHLLRRLTLDFRDVINRGFTFDSAHITGTIQNGNVNIPKASVLGSAATVVLGGQVNLNRETLDLKAIILPAINVGGPSLALALVNPAVGIGTFVTQWLFKDQLSQIFRMEYAIEGSFDNPQVQKLQRPDLNTLPSVTP